MIQTVDYRWSLMQYWLRSIHVYEFTVPVRTVSYYTPDCESNRMRSYFRAYPTGGACVFNVVFGHQSPRACSAPRGLSQNHDNMQIRLVTWPAPIGRCFPADFTSQSEILTLAANHCLNQSGSCLHLCLPVWIPMTGNQHDIFEGRRCHIFERRPGILARSISIGSDREYWKLRTHGSRIETNAGRFSRSRSAAYSIVKRTQPIWECMHSISEIIILNNDQQQHQKII